MRFICVLAIPRTGSSHVNKLLKSIPQINAKSELFHQNTPAHLAPREEAALERSGARVDDRDLFNAWRRRNPFKTLEAIAQGGRGSVVAFKVFPNHLPRDTVRTEFFASDEVGIVVLKRRPIECFISSSKARSVRTFTKVDTTALKTSLSAEGFAEWAPRMRKWYGWAENDLNERGKPFGTISYERHLDGKTGRESLEYILPMLRSLGFDRLSMPDEVIEGERQDQEPRYRDRVANWDAFEEELRADVEHSELLDWAMAQT